MEDSFPPPIDADFRSSRRRKYSSLSHMLTSNSAIRLTPREHEQSLTQDKARSSYSWLQFGGKSFQGCSSISAYSPSISEDLSFDAKVGKREQDHKVKATPGNVGMSPIFTSNPLLSPRGDFDNSRSVLPTCGYSNCASQISTNTVVDIIRGKYKEMISDYVIVDCRFDYEFEGGHIQGALNLYRKEDIKRFYQRIHEQSAGANSTNGGRRAVIFHCEFSQLRGPTLCKYFRSLDRAANGSRYPLLDIEEVHVMRGGYRTFFANESFRKYCKPCGYINMREERFKQQLEERKQYLVPCLSNSTSQPANRHNLKDSGLQRRTKTATRCFKRKPEGPLNFENHNVSESSRAFKPIKNNDKSDEGSNETLSLFEVSQKDGKLQTIPLDLDYTIKHH
eukprot:CAMPEP_0184490312 /NCGR_PEP_ID=MMETSP0113_2-20130426/17549_1 /TAXON_ID=91329 /ORGANISM="Norrisiella sphaerica, Strain BC52" /LENGTH=392 /DNA_ID=CAMNT_0026874125 /DNA_START=37 /DNA_END=1215 /DNA_ORIENTATION=+